MTQLALILYGIAIAASVAAICSAVFTYRASRRSYGEVVAPVLDLCEQWDGLSKGESATTRQIREAVRKGLEGADLPTGG